MTPFEDYAEQSNLAHDIYQQPLSLFDFWLVDHMPKTEREVIAMRKAWEAGADMQREMFIERLDPIFAEMSALKRLRDDLHETTNRYLERARKAEAEAAFNALQWAKAEKRSGYYAMLANSTTGKFQPFDASKAAEIAETGKQTLTLLNLSSIVDRLKLLNDLELKPTDSPALYLQQFGRALRPGYKPPSRWQRFKAFFAAWLNP